MGLEVFLLQFLKRFRRDWLLYKCLIKFSYEAVWSWAFFGGGFLKMEKLYTVSKNNTRS